jgi:hypothetical protein
VGSLRAGALDHHAHQDRSLVFALMPTLVARPRR